jgi:hypothetical protein
LQRMTGVAGGVETAVNRQQITQRRNARIGAGHGLLARVEAENQTIIDRDFIGEGGASNKQQKQGSELHDTTS